MSNISPDVQKLKLTLEQYAQIHPVHIEENNGKKIIFSTPTIPTKWRAERLYINEPKTLEWISNFDQDDTMFDVGANVGMYSIWAAATKGINVIAIEPESQNYAVLNKNILLNNLKDKVTALCFAMSDEEKISELNLSSFTAGQALHGFDKPMNTVDVYSEKLEEFKPVFTQGCMAMTIDSLVERGIPSPDHIKIDVDGFEDKVIAGGMQTIIKGKVKTILIEINQNIDKHIEIVKDLENLGYIVDNKTDPNYIFRNC